MTKSEIWEVTATLTIPRSPEAPIMLQRRGVKSLVNAVSSKLQGNLEKLTSSIKDDLGIEIEFSVSSQKTGELTQ